MNNKKWYTIQITPLETDKMAHKFRIETKNLDKTMEKYTHDKEGNVTALWEVIR